MKKILIFLLLVTVSLGASGWGRLGHATIAEIAERHLTPAAKAHIEHYTQGTPLASFASWMDDVVAQPPFDVELAGWHASICTPDCRTPLWVRKERRNCRDGVTAMEYFREYLKDYEEMPDSIVLQAIKCIVHIVGDFHCPQHVRYTDAQNEGKFPITFFGEERTYHQVWDTGLIQYYSGLVYTDYRTFADRLDTWNRRQVRKATRGWAREWFEDCARDVRPIVNKVREGDALGQDFVDANKDLAELELRKAAYQLAKALNTIFQ